MPQEIRQMPERKMVLLVEGQRPIFGDKLRFFRDTAIQVRGSLFTDAHSGCTADRISSDSTCTGFDRLLRPSRPPSRICRCLDYWDG
nr:type IV secretory system conjugative DNA transfer family protein [Mesorhizobium sp. M00.F.Ca.ET.216.01.1.1]